ncbi:MAG: hypothetical protein ACLGHP_12755, partial [Vicinamibacteria bacterium]
LYYRLNVIELDLPPLARRSDDIVPLAEHFMDGSGKALDASAARALQRHAWPGNVRELRNAVEAALVAVGPGRLLRADHLPAPAARAPAPSTACAAHIFSGAPSSSVHAPGTGL